MTPRAQLQKLRQQLRASSASDGGGNAWKLTEWIQEVHRKYPNLEEQSEVWQREWQAEIDANDGYLTPRLCGSLPIVLIEFAFGGFRHRGVRPQAPHEETTR